MRVTRGREFDVAVDLRKSSPAFGQWAEVELMADNHRQFCVPPGFGHAFLVLSEQAGDHLERHFGLTMPAWELALRLCTEEGL